MYLAPIDHYSESLAHLPSLPETALLLCNYEIVLKILFCQKKKKDILFTSVLVHFTGFY